MKTDTRKMSLAALFAALTAVGAFLQIPLGISAITLQFLFTALAGVLLGPKWGALSQAVYVMIGLAGVPVFTQGGGLGYLLQPTCGFLFGLIPAAWIVGKLTERQHGCPRVFLASAAGLAALYLVGIPYMYVIMNAFLGKGMSLLSVLNAGMLLFLPGDAAKLAVTAAVSRPLLSSLRRE